MAMVMEKREAESARYERRKERTMISECHVSVMIQSLNFYLYKMGNKLIFYI